MAEAIDRGSVYRSAALAVLLQWSVRLIGLVSVVILARLLSPADFGLVGLATAALAFVELLGSVGLRQALLRLPEPERADLDTAWTLQLILFAGMGLIALASAPLVGWIYGEPALAAIVAVLSARFFLFGFTNIGIVDFERKLQFGRDMAMRLSSRLLALVATLAVALLLHSYWALVVGLVCQSGFLAIGSWVVHPYRPRLSLERRRELLGLSLWIFVHNLALTVQQQVERLVLGRFGTAHLIGLFSVSKDLAEMFTQEISTALNRVTFVTVAQSGVPLDGSPDRVARILGTYAMIAAPMGFGLAATAEDSVRVLLGEQWTGAAPLLQVVAVYSAFFAVYKVIATSLQAAGEAKRAAWLSAVGALLLVVCVAGAAAAAPTAMAIAWAGFTANLAILVGGVAVIARRAQAGLALLASSVVRPFAAAGLMFLIVRSAAPASSDPLADLAVAVAVGAAAYPLLLLALWNLWGRPPSAEAEALGVVRRGWSAWTGRRAAPAEGA